jgi:D-glycero-D-manno-heptose 1,7-bisphosphate phosphatase
MAHAENSLKAAVFLDRDGTLNVDKGYLYLWEDWEWLPGAMEALRLLSVAGYSLVVVTNQSGVARRLYTEKDVMSLHAKVNEDLEKSGLKIEAFYYCPHHPDLTGPCNCRKPSPEMILAAAKDLGLDLSRSFLVGDKLSDILAAKAAKVNPILVRTGYGSGIAKLPDGVRVTKDILEAAQLITRANF